MGRDEDNRSLGERMRRPPALRLGMSDDVDSVASADLTMRVKALEADVAEAFVRLRRLTSKTIEMAEEIERLRSAQR